MRTSLRRALCAALAIYAPTLLAQPTPHFEDCAEQTGSSASLLLPSSLSVAIAAGDGPPRPIEIGDEIAVVTPEGLCAGTLTWLDDAAALALWEDNPETPEKDGFASGDPLAFRLWSLGTRRELAAVEPAAFDSLFEASGTFVPDAIYVVTDLAFDVRAQGGGPAFALEPNYPNPFVSRTTLPYAIGEAADVRLDVFDLRGRRVATLVDEHLGPGRYEAHFDAVGLASGTYLARLTAGDHVESRRLQLVR